jgi:hypothetical protein
LATIDLGFEYASGERATVPVPLETFGTSQFGKPEELGSSKSSHSVGLGLAVAQKEPPEETPSDDESLLVPESLPEPEPEPDPSELEPASDAPPVTEPTSKHPSHAVAARGASHAFEVRTAR